MKDKKNPAAVTARQGTTTENDTKVCTKCKEEKSIKAFHKNRDSKDGRLSTCNVCCAKVKTNYYRTMWGFVQKVYMDQRACSKRRRHPMPTYTLDELRAWAFTKKKFHTLFYRYRDSGFEKWAAPSFDRIDDYKGYSFDNIQLMTWKENHNKNINDVRAGINRKTSKAVIQYNEQGKIVGRFVSCSAAIRKNPKLSASGLSQCCNGKIPTHKGYYWRFENE